MDCLCLRSGGRRDYRPNFKDIIYTQTYTDTLIDHSGYRNVKPVSNRDRIAKPNSNFYPIAYTKPISVLVGIAIAKPISNFYPTAYTKSVSNLDVIVNRYAHPDTCREISDTWRLY